jgi:uncharacterized protein (TIGR01777 family)
MHILITGGTGLIGRAFIRQFQHKYKFTVVTRDPQKALSYFNNANIGAVSLDSLDNLNDYDAIINLAGEPIADKRWTNTQKQNICHSRWDITQQLVSLCEESNEPPKVFLSGSAVGFYGRQDETRIDESYTAVHPEFSHDICAQWERIAQGVDKAKTRMCIMRTGVVLSRDGGALSKMYLPFKLGIGGRVSSGTQGFSWIHIDDMVNAMAFLLEHDTCSGVFNFTAPEPVSNAVFSQTLAKTLHRPCLLPVPKLSLRILMGESADLLLYGQYVLPQALLDAGYTFAFSDVSSALANIYD